MSIVLAAAARAQEVAIDRSASIINFPRVVVDNETDTTIQIVNTGNSVVQARCFYVTGQASTEFALTLTRQQPTVWVVSHGRLPSNAPPGLNPLVPSLTPPFHGELMCVEVLVDGSPISGNHLIGAATLIDSVSGDVAKYHAIGLQGFDNDQDNTLCLGGSGSSDCPFGAEYSACPQSWSMDFTADGAPDSLAGAGSSVHTTLSFAPCSLDLASQSFQPINVQFALRNQLAVGSSTSTSITGPSERALASISAFTRTQLGTDYGRVQIAGGFPAGTGILVVAQEFHQVGAMMSSAAINSSAQGQRAGADVIRLPFTSPPPPNSVIFTPPGSAGNFASLGGITTGPDGNLWFTERFANQIGRITPDGSSIAEFAVATADAGPDAITAGPDGNLWFTEMNVSQIGRIGIAGAPVREFEIPSGASSITAGPEGNVWFTELVANTIGRITPDGAMLTEFPAGSEDRLLTSITTGPDGNLWFTEDGSQGGLSDRIGRMTPAGTNVVHFDLPPGTRGPASIVTGPDGNLWFTEPVAGQIGRITPTGGIAEFAASATVIAPFTDGNLWFTGDRQLCSIGKITPEGRVTTFLGACGYAITGGPDENLWLLERGNVLRFSP